MSCYTLIMGADAYSQADVLNCQKYRYKEMKNNVNYKTGNLKKKIYFF